MFVHSVYRLPLLCFSAFATLWTDTFSRDEEDVFQEKTSEVIARITSKRFFKADNLPNPLSLQLGMRPCYLQM